MIKVEKTFVIISLSFLLVVCSAIPYLQAESKCPMISAPGIYVNHWPAFMLKYPAHWQVKKPEPGSLFRAEPSEGIPSLRISVIPGMDMPLENMSAYFLPTFKKKGQNIKVLYDKAAMLEDSTPIREMEIEWEPYGGPKLNTLFLTVENAGVWIVISLSNTKGTAGEDLRKIPYSLKIRPHNENAPDYRYSIPKVMDDGWSTAHVTDVNLDEIKLTEMINQVSNGTYPDVHSVLIVKGGKLVLETYFPGQNIIGDLVDFTLNDTRRIMSVTKSFASTLIGIAIDKGFVEGTDEKLISFFPEFKQILSVDNKKDISLKQLLTMTAGLDWEEDTYHLRDPRNPIHILLGPAKHNMSCYMLNRPLKYQPGQRFTYNSCLSILLGAILEKATGLEFTKFADQYLFQPMGITDYAWGYLDTDHRFPSTGWGLQLRPRDMAKLGYLYANKGRWHGRQIISSSWIEEAVHEHTRFSPMWKTGYGYQWWLYRFRCENIPVDAYGANGFGGQRILVFPTIDLIVVFTAGNYSIPYDLVNKMMYSMVHAYILPSTIARK